MRVLLILTTLLICLSTLANCYKTMCGIEGNYCNDGQVCIEKQGIANCVMVEECKEVAVVQTIDKTWIENGKSFTLYRTHVANYGNFKITKLSIDTDCSLYLRDMNSIWGVVLNGTELSIPSYANGIEAKEYYNFGYIVLGTVAPRLTIASVCY